MSAPEPTNSDHEFIHWRSICAAIAAISAVGIAIGLGLPLLSLILEKRGVSSTLIGLNSAMVGLAAIGVAPLTTPVARRFGVANTMVCCVLISAVSGMGFYYAENFLLWFPLRLIFHGAITVLFILSEFWINASAPPQRRGLVLGIYSTVLALGFAAGPLIFSLVGSEGIKPFLVGSMIILLSAIPILIARDDNPILDNTPTTNFMKYILLVPTATAAVFVFGAVEAGGLSLFPIFATRSGFSETDGALLLTMIGLGSVLFQIPLGLLADRVPDKRGLLFLCAFIGFGGSLALIPLISNWYATAAALLVWGGCVAGLYTIGLNHLGTRLKGSDLAAANAAFIFCYAIGTLVGPQTVGIAMDVYGPNGFAGAITFFFGLYIVLTLFRLVFNPKHT